MKRCVAVLSLILAAPVVTALMAQSPQPAVVRLDPALDRIISTSARLEILKSDYFGISEGPVWVQEPGPGYLLFSDIGANAIYKWTPDGMLSVFLDKAGYS